MTCFVNVQSQGIAQKGENIVVLDYLVVAF